MWAGLRCIVSKINMSARDKLFWVGWDVNLRPPVEGKMSTELLCVLGSPEWSTLYWTETQEGSWERVRRTDWWVYAGSYQQVSGIIYMAPLGCFHLRTNVATREINISIIDCPSKERSFKCKSPGWSTSHSLCLSTLCQKYLSSENWNGTDYL